MINDSGMTSEQEYLSSMESYRVWLYDNYPINNGDMLLQLEESAVAQIRYLQEHNLPIDTELT
jgi:hypothetical protein